MIDHFPEPHELLSFFETEPTLADPGNDYGWTYNTLTFTTIRGDERLTSEIWPSGGRILLIWEQAGERRMTLDLHHVQTLQVEAERASETLVARFAEGSVLKDLRLRVKPSISILWGTSE